MIDLNRKPESFLKPCPKCNGTGSVQNTFWAEWSNLILKFQSEGLTYEEAKQKANKAMDDKYGGFEVWESIPKEDECENCSGEGRLLSLELKPVAELLYLLKRYNFEE